MDLRRRTLSDITLLCKHSAFPVQQHSSCQKGHSPLALEHDADSPNGTKQDEVGKKSTNRPARSSSSIPKCAPTFLQDWPSFSHISKHFSITVSVMRLVPSWRTRKTRIELVHACYRRTKQKKTNNVLFSTQFISTFFVSSNFFWNSNNKKSQKVESTKHLLMAPQSVIRVFLFLSRFFWSREV